MAEVVERSTAFLEDGDLRAVAVYLKELPGQDDGPAPVAADNPAMRAGETIYVDACSACHNRGGTGVAQLIPALRASPAVQQASAQNPIRVVLQGAQSSQNAHAVTGPAMPALGWKLSDQQVADVVTYTRNAWGNAAAAVSAEDVRKVRADLAKRVE